LGGPLQLLFSACNIESFDPQESLSLISYIGKAAALHFGVCARMHACDSPLKVIEGADAGLSWNDSRILPTQSAACAGLPLHIHLSLSHHTHLVLKCT